MRYLFTYITFCILHLQKYNFSNNTSAWIQNSSAPCSPALMSFDWEKGCVLFSECWRMLIVFLMICLICLVLLCQGFAVLVCGVECELKCACLSKMGLDTAVIISNILAHRCETRQGKGWGVCFACDAEFPFVIWEVQGTVHGNVDTCWKHAAPVIVRAVSGIWIISLRYVRVLKCSFVVTV